MTLTRHDLDPVMTS